MFLFSINVMIRKLLATSFVSTSNSFVEKLTNLVLDRVKDHEINQMHIEFSVTGSFLCKYNIVYWLYE